MELYVVAEVGSRTYVLIDRNRKRVAKPISADRIIDMKQTIGDWGRPSHEFINMKTFERGEARRINLFFRAKQAVIQYLPKEQSQPFWVDNYTLAMRACYKWDSALNSMLGPEELQTRA